MTGLDREERTVMFRQRGAGFVGRSPVRTTNGRTIAKGRSGWMRRTSAHLCALLQKGGGRRSAARRLVSARTVKPGVCAGRAEPRSQVNRRISVQPGCACERGNV